MSTSPNEGQSAKPAESQTQPAAQAAAAKQRSTLEKIVVRVLIFALVVFAAVEARAKYGYEWTLNGLKSAFEDKENATDTKLGAVEFKLFPTQERTKKNGFHYVTLHWFSFVRGNYEVKLTVDSDEDDALVLSYETPEAGRFDATAKKRGGGEEGNDELPPAGGPGVTGGPGGGPGGAGGPGGGRGGRRFDPQAMFAENDKNKDGKLQKDEWPERMTRMLEGADENKDGTVTKEEMDKAVERFRQRRGRKRPGGADRKRQRPPSDDDEAKKPAGTSKTTPGKTEKKKPAKTEPKKPVKTEKKSEKKPEAGTKKKKKA